jgi:hypothetical protein
MSLKLFYAQCSCYASCECLSSAELVVHMLKRDCDEHHCTLIYHLKWQVYIIVQYAMSYIVAVEVFQTDAGQNGHDVRLATTGTGVQPLQRCLTNFLLAAGH